MKRSKKCNVEIEVIAEAGDEPEKKNNAEMIVASKKSHERTKKTDVETGKLILRFLISKFFRMLLSADFLLVRLLETEKQKIKKIFSEKILN